MLRVWLPAIAVIIQTVGSQQEPWRPPAGVPMPPFGILEKAPAPTLYVDYARGRDTNPGTSARPRQTIPLVLPRCTVVSIAGNYPVAHEAPQTLEAQGTPDCPVFIQGGVHTKTWEVSGSHLIIEQAKRGYLQVRATMDGRDTHEVALRDLEFTGGGVGVQATFSARGEVRNVVGLRLNIHDLGDMNTTADQDVVGFGIYRERNHHIWFLDSRCERVSSDCFQANAQGDPAGVHHIYAGRITCRNNRQGCLWAKQSEDVVFSESTCTEMRPDKGALNPGQCFGAQYDARRLLILKNQMSNSENGIVLGSFDYGTPQGGVVIAGNLITNIHHTTTDDRLENPWSGGAAIRLSGGVTALVINNTIWDVDGGIQIPAGGATTTVINTIIGQARRAAFQVEQRDRLRRVTHSHFEPAPRFWVAGINVVATTADLAKDTNSIGSPAFVNAAAGDFRLAENSPLRRAGLPLLALEAPYRASHGVGFDLELAKPAIGAGLKWEAVSPPPAPAPKPPPTSTPPPPCNQFFLKLFGWRLPTGCQ